MGDGFGNELHDDVNAGPTISADIARGAEVQQRSRSISVDRLDQVMHHMYTAAIATASRLHSKRVPQPLGQPPSYDSIADYPRQAAQSLLQVEVRKSSQQHPHEQLDDSSQEEHSARVFHNPYVQCHRNLVWRNTNVPLSDQHWPCVHANCSYVSETAQQWLEHATMPHHDLQAPQPVSNIMEA